MLLIPNGFSRFKMLLKSEFQVKATRMGFATSLPKQGRMVDLFPSYFPGAPILYLKNFL
jgi:hypothetical protein